MFLFSLVFAAQALAGLQEEVPAGSGRTFGKRWAGAAFPAQGSRSPLLLVESYLHDSK